MLFGRGSKNNDNQLRTPKGATPLSENEMRNISGGVPYNDERFMGQRLDQNLERIEKKRQQREFGHSNTLNEDFGMKGFSSDLKGKDGFSLNKHHNDFNKGFTNDFGNGFGSGFGSGEFGNNSFGSNGFGNNSFGSNGFVNNSFSEDLNRQEFGMTRQGGFSNNSSGKPNHI